jgi:hypothetical protein
MKVLTQKKFPTLKHEILPLKTAVSIQRLKNTLKKRIAEGGKKY